MNFVCTSKWENYIHDWIYLILVSGYEIRSYKFEFPNTPYTNWELCYLYVCLKCCRIWKYLFLLHNQKRMCTGICTHYIRCSLPIQTVTGIRRLPPLHLLISVYKLFLSQRLTLTCIHPPPSTPSSKKNNMFALCVYTTHNANMAKCLILIEQI